MATLAPIAPSSTYTPDATPHPPTPDPAPRWNLATRVAFRVCFVYFGLYVLTTQMLYGLLPVPALGPAISGSMRPVQALVQWIGANVLRIPHPISAALTGSGDKTYDWVHAFSLLLIAGVAAAAWSLLARTTRHHAAMYRWFRLFIRLAVATTMLSYGFSKVFPLQMPVLALKRLVEPFGNFSPMGVLWYSVGASPAYEIFVGCAEVGGGLLLFLPRTTPLGALVCLMDAIAIFTLNMTYDVPVKLFAFHLILLSLFLIAPNLPRLFDLFVRHVDTRLTAEPPIGGGVRARRTAVTLQVLFGAYTVFLGVTGGMQSWKTRGGGAPRSPLYGIWDVDQMVVDGQPRAPLITDSTRWRRVIFQRPTAASFQRPNDAFVDYAAAIDTTAKTLTLTSTDSAKNKSPLSYQRPTAERLVVDGTLDGQTVHLELVFRDPDAFLQRSRGFHWIQEAPFNR